MKTTVKEIVDLYWALQEAEEHYSESTQAKALACGLAEEFHEMMVNLRKPTKSSKKVKGKYDA